MPGKSEDLHLDHMGIIERNQRLEELDRRYIWHPFTQMKEWEGERPLVISEGRGSFLKDIYGNWYLDGVSSIWVNIHGHRKKEIDDAVKKQLCLLGHSTLLGAANVPSIELAERLVSITPEGLSRVFYSDNGSTSVEISLKMAYQYWASKGVTGKKSFICLNHAYHGDTIGAVSVGGIDLFHETFKPLLFRTFKAPSPYCYRCELGREYPGCSLACLEGMEEILKAHSAETAAVIIEPMVQGAGGIIVHPPGYLKGIRELTEKYDVLLIADEVAVGFGRTGEIFASNHEDVTPHILCLSKGITGGYLPLAATVTTEEIYNAFLGEYSEFKTFFHGHSYTGNPLACAAAIASIDLFEKDKLLDNVKANAVILQDWINGLLQLDYVGDARSSGLMGGVELVKDKEKKEDWPFEDRVGHRVCMKAREKGLLIRPLGNVVVIMPPLSISSEHLTGMLEIISSSIEESIQQSEVMD